MSYMRLSFYETAASNNYYTNTASNTVLILHCDYNNHWCHMTLATHRTTYENIAQLGAPHSWFEPTGEWSTVWYNAYYDVKLSIDT